MKENSPFTPGSPVPVELFVGRVKEIEEVLRYLRQSSSGRQENVFLSGERGIGKSSFVDYLCSIATKDENFVAVHVFSGGVDNLEELVRRIFEQLINALNSQAWWEKIAKSFESFTKYINKIDVFGVSLGFNPPHADLKDLVRQFPDTIHNLTLKIKENDKRGIFIALDDINGLSKTPDFANWYKSFVDSIPNKYPSFPVLIMPIGLPEIRDALSEIQPSLMRIFRVVEIYKLSDNEVIKFFTNAFKKVNIQVDKTALDILVKYSSGLPIFMHEIGDGVFWIDEDNQIDPEDAFTGIFTAAERIGKKYLDPKVYRAIRSVQYKSILRKVGEQKSSETFNKREIQRILDDKEKKALNNFLTKMQELGIITQDLERGRGFYKFVNQMYFLYVRIESIRSKKEMEKRSNNKKF